MKVNGLPITIESPKGSLRVGAWWTQLMANDYGYINNTIAIDGDEVDVFIGPNLRSTRTFVVTQNNPNTGMFDEFKVMLGFDSIEEAEKAYFRNYQLGWEGFEFIKEIPDFWKWYATTLSFLYATN